MSTAIPFVQNFAFEYGMPEQISPNVRRLVANNPGPFTGWGTNVYLIGQDEVFLCDPGPDTDAHFEVLCNALQGQSLCGVLVTHHHADHSPMAKRLAAHFDCQTFGFGPPIGEQDQRGPQLDAGDDLQFCPDILLVDGQEITAKSCLIRCVYTPGHTSNHMCYAVLPDNGLICGDHVLGWTTSVVIPPDGRMDQYLASLQKVLDEDFAELWPGHGPQIKTPKQFLSAYLDHRLHRDKQILTALELGAKTISDLVPTIYPTLDARLIPAASISLLAHLIRLCEMQKVSSDDGPSLEAKFYIRP